MSVKMRLCCLLTFLAAGLFPADARSMPWDTEMYKQQSFKPNEMARAPAEGTVPLGGRELLPTSEESEKKLVNAEEFSLNSVWRGQRLWDVNCFTCHGKVGDGQGVVGKQMGVPSLLSDFYKSRTDQHVFLVIQNGGANMPRYGYKLSHLDSWAVVNYLRFLQGRDVAGLKRPQ